MLSKLLTFLIPIYFFSLLVSCNKNTALDKKNEIEKKSSYLTSYNDSDIFIYKSNIAISRDAEILYPKSFKIVLPKGLKSYEVLHPCDFSFYYPNKQIIYIKIDLDKKHSDLDTTYVPSENEFTGILRNNYSLLNSSNNFKNNYSVSGAKKIIIKKSEATILLYNIKPRNYKYYYNYLKQFKFL